MAASYGYDISGPAKNAREAVQWLYFGCVDDDVIMAVTLPFSVSAPSFPKRTLMGRNDTGMASVLQVRVLTKVTGLPPCPT